MSDIRFLCDKKDAKIVTKVLCKSQGVLHENYFASSTFDQWEGEMNKTSILEILGGTEVPNRTIVEIKIMSYDLYKEECGNE